jgi:hypothetical protein
MEPKQEKKEVEKPEAVIIELEQRGYVEAKKALPIILGENKTKMDSAGEQLKSFMTAGAEEFKERTGRPMTYAEMRAAWG